MEEERIDNGHIVLSVPRRLVKQVKSALETQKAIDRTIKITSEPTPNGNSSPEPRMTIPTTIPYPSSDTATNNLRTTILTRLNLLDATQEIAIHRSTKPTNPNHLLTHNPLLKALKPALESLPPDLLASLALTPTLLTTTFPQTYTLYKPLLLLPSTLLTQPPWQTLLTAHPPPSPSLHPLWHALTTSLAATHLAINASIPLHNSPSTPNTFRSPTNILPLYPPSGLGPPPTPQTQTSPTPTDFAAALWVSHTQHGVAQVWAPLYTMFSRGNVREKARLLRHADVTRLADEPASATAVDLYAGIGYFAFMYRRAGVRRVLCWEVNAWSVEGLRRGAARNGWRVCVVRAEVLAPVVEGCGEEEAVQKLREEVRRAGEADFVVFPCSNEFAVRIVRAVWGEGTDGGEVLPPVRHVNCGLLPSSRGSWRAAVELVDGQMGGWVHVHENVGVGEVEVRREEVLCEMRGYLEASGDGMRKEKRVVQCVHVERVKTYAPGVLHVVYDIWIGPGEPEGSS